MMDSHCGNLTALWSCGLMWIFSLALPQTLGNIDDKIGAKLRVKLVIFWPPGGSKPDLNIYYYKIFVNLGI